ncbi:MULTISPECIES: HD-GYP domain-containing protein [unclassified Acidovorax]|jgi:putative two-component system response regulator|uniref:HD-GYP domain-containing protein n=1 Tax=Acidovorax TaxID=12916 RepID=UPI0006FE9265|nr:MULTISPECIES: two-component system response regulator [unclassified Acidovorax]KQW32823.1 two-component system response regulator [Acidovorax sp. Root402]KRD46662.1 two-component system response regulator [Acidovorax sp. Root275]MBD9408029.1 two-component system response regulator [Acidovorax sp. ACV02]MBV7543515.1 two-component system response regulator [Acidovorax sp. sic0104]PIF25248.1 putative two-component system response regulator [Acidovorax sp. 56]
MLKQSEDSPRPLVLAVDDSSDNLWVLSGLLKDQYRVKLAGSGEKALQIARSIPAPDLILLDVMMPDLSGYEVCRQLKAAPATRDIPIIFLTAMTGTEDEKVGLALGAADFITKPINPPIVLARVATQLQAKAGADFLRDQNQFLQTEVHKRTRELAAIQDVTILAMASLAETRDNETGNHIRRTQHYVKALATALKTHPRFSTALSDHVIDMLYKSAPLHDIGKVGIPDRILLKPGRFEPHEFEIMKTHTTLGRDAIQHAEDQLGMPVEFLQYAKEIAYGHQEKWDGSGYPQGLAGEAIPLSARIMAVADVYDALISRRVYKDGMPHEKAVDIMREGRGSHFDPDILDAFLGMLEEFQRIAQKFADSDAEMADKAKHLELATAVIQPSS